MTSNERIRRAAREWRCSSRPAKAGRGDRAQRGGRGAGLDDGFRRRRSSSIADAPSTMRSLSSGRPLRAGPVGTVPLRRYRGAENKFVLATRLRPSLASRRSRNETTFLDPPPEQQGGGAPKGAHPLAASLQTGLRSVRNRLLMRQRLLREPLAFRRSAAALAGASERSSSAQAALHATKRMQALPAPSIALKPGTWRPGHNAGRVDARTARERVTSPPAGTALAPSNGCHR